MIGEKCEVRGGATRGALPRLRGRVEQGTWFIYALPPSMLCSPARMSANLSIPMIFEPGSAVCRR